MAAISGATGTFALGTTAALSGTIHTTNWELNISKDTLETTNFDTTNPWKEFIGNMVGAEGTFQGFLQAATALSLTDIALMDAAAAVAFTLTASTGKTFSGNAIITGLTPSSSKKGVAAVSGSFQVSGAVTGA